MRELNERIEILKKQIEEEVTKEAVRDGANTLMLIKNGFKDAGFTEEQAFSITMKIFEKNL